MTPERLAEIRERVTYNPEDWPITIELVAQIDSLTAENARLKGEKVDCLKKAYDQEVTIISLKAQVEHYKLQSDQLCDRVEVLAAENATLKGEVERLEDCQSRAGLKGQIGQLNSTVKRMAQDNATLRSKLDALVTAGEKVVKDSVGSLAQVGPMDFEPVQAVNIESFQDFSAAVTQAKGEK